MRILESTASIHTFIGRWPLLRGRAVLGNAKHWVMQRCQRVRRTLISEGYRRWDRLSTQRHLLAMPPNRLSIVDRIRCCFMRWLLSLPDPFYRRFFNRLDARKDRLNLPRVGECKHRLLLGIGTLGPGGAERQLAMTVKGLASRGMMDVRVLCYCLDSDINRFFAPILEKCGIPFTDIKSSFDPNGPHATHLRQVISGFQPELRNDIAAYILALWSDPPVTAHFWLDEINVKGGVAAVLVGVPNVILGLRSLPPIHFPLHRPYMREAYRWLARQPNVSLVNNSHAGARGYENWLGLPAGSIHVVHNGFDWQDYQGNQLNQSAQDYRIRHGVQPRQLVMGTVIRLSEEKRPLFWLEIAAKVRQKVPNAYFLVVGDGPLRESLELRAAEPDLCGAIRFTGYERNTMAAMAAMDLFLLTSRAEGLPNVLIEAQIAGVPVVTTKVGGAPETVRHGVTGWVLDNDDIDAAAEIIARLLLDQNWRARANTNMKKFVHETFCVERMVDCTLEIYGLTSGQFKQEEGRKQ